MRLGLAAMLLVLAAPARGESPLVKARPYYARTPARHDPGRPAPLLLFLHPYSPQDGRQALDRFEVAPIADDKGLLLAAPDGLQGRKGAPHFWNATDACCDFARTGVDDVAYLDAVIADMRARYRVDEARIFVLGYSNGGGMAHRLLCDRSPTIAAAASIAGFAWKDAARCRPTASAALLEIHGDADELVRYEGGIFGGAAYPSAPDGVAAWAKVIECRAPGQAKPSLDLLPELPGAETAVTAFPCLAGAAELWTVHGGTHRGLAPTIRAAVDFLLAHPKSARQAARVEMR